MGQQIVNDMSLIEQMINKYDYVILLHGVNVAYRFRTLAESCMTMFSVMALSAEEINFSEGHIHYSKLSKELAECLYNLYHTYEFSDNFILLEDSSVYAGLSNYVKTGLLTPEETWQALLH